MPRFFGPKDLNLIQSINNELINWVLETPITLYKVVTEESDVNDIYGESINKKYYSGIKFNCLISMETEESVQTEIGRDIKRKIKVAINKELLKPYNIVPEIGDIIEFNSMHWEIDNVIQNQLIMNRENINFSYVCHAHLTNFSYINLEERTL